MKKNLFVFFLCIVTSFSFCQNNRLWKGYFSYNQVSDLAEASTRIYASAENTLFYKTLSNSEIKTQNSIDGLSGLTIAAIYHSDAVNRTFIGYENGLLLMVNQQTGQVSRYVGIRDQEGGIPPNKKRINHFFERNNTLYIATDFGIVEFNLTTFLFGDTFIIGTGGSQVEVRQTIVVQNTIYAITKFNGIRSANVNSPFLVNFNNWSQINNGFWTGAASLNNELITSGQDGNIYRYNGTFFIPIFNALQPAVDIRARDSRLIITTPSRVVVLNETFGQLLAINSTQLPENLLTFSCATLINNILYIGTKEQGMYEVSLDNPATFNNILPDGPSRNRIFRIQVAPSGTLWAVFGDYSEFYNPFPLDEFGISKYTPEGWLNIPYSDVLEANTLCSITVNPNNENEVYASSYFKGLLKLEDDVPTTLFNSSNSSLEQSPTNPAVGFRIGHSVFDRQGNLWMTNAFMENLLKVKRNNNQWGSFNFSSVLSAPTPAGRIEVDKNNTKWICTLDEGLIGFNENGNRFKKLTAGDDQGNLPIKAVQTIAIDRRNQLWIGTKKGIRVLPSVDRFLSEDGQLRANPIIIVEDGLPQELLFEQFITDIVVDGANNKWVGTADAGVFQFSPNGQETLQRFTESNSPLPSNIILDIDINQNTGEVFFVTERGTVSFQSVSTGSNEDLGNVIVYPNPVRPEFTGTVKISGLVDRANIKITDIEGNLVHEAIAQGGTIEWDTTAFGSYKVASGVYMIFIATQDGAETKVKKVMIIR